MFMYFTKSTITFVAGNLYLSLSSMAKVLSAIYISFICETKDMTPLVVLVLSVFKNKNHRYK